MTGPPTGAATLTIEGRGFLNLQQPPTVSVGSQKASDVRICSNSEISCSIPPGLGRNLAVKVTPSASFYPGKPIVERTQTATQGSPAGTRTDMQGCLEIAGHTTILGTGFSYNGR